MCSNIVMQYSINTVSGGERTEVLCSNHADSIRSMIEQNARIVSYPVWFKPVGIRFLGECKYSQAR